MEDSDKSVFHQDRLENRNIDELIGMCKMAIADNKVVQEEAEFLQSWLKRNYQFSQIWPTKHIFDRVNLMLSDGVLDIEEQKELLELLKDFSGASTAEDIDNLIVKDPKGAAKKGVVPVSMSTKQAFDDPVPEIIIGGNSFCFTGQFYYGSRKLCQNETIRQAGEIHKAVRHVTDYLVVGTAATRSWITSTFGNKILKAQALRKEGKNKDLKIVSEKDWVEAIEK